MEYNKIAMREKKKIAIVAHDNKKSDLLEWAKFNKDLLARHELYATGTTGALLERGTWKLKSINCRAVPWAVMSR